MIWAILQRFRLIFHVRIVMLTLISLQPSWERNLYFKDVQQLYMIELNPYVRDMISASICYFGIIVLTRVGNIGVLWTMYDS